jgi:Polysaccharide lyase
MSKPRALPLLLAFALLASAIPAAGPALASAAGSTATIAVGKGTSLSSARHRSERRRGYGAAKRKLAAGRKGGGVQKAVALASSSPSTSGLLFKASRINEFWLNQSAPGAVTEVPDPTGSGETAIQMNVSDSDVAPITPTENPRAELISDPIFEAGSEFWASAKFYLPTEFPTTVPGWLTLLEGPYGAPYAGTPPWHIEVSGSSIRWARNNTYNWDVPWEMPVVRGSWVNVLLHERFASDGWIEMWINGQPITFFAGHSYNPNHVAPTTRLAMQTMDSTTNGGPSAIHEMNYRQVGMFSSVSVLEGPLAIGTSRESVSD